MTPETQALIDRIASGTTTAADAEKVKAFVEAFDVWYSPTGGPVEFDAMEKAREALK